MKREILILLAAIVMGVAAVVFTEIRMASIQEAMNSQISNKVAVCIMKDPAPAQRMLTAEMLDSSDVPDAYRHPQSILWKERSRIIGQRLRFPMQAEQPLIWSDILESSKRTIGGSILPGRGVVTIPIDMIGGVSGLISPGAQVDVVGVFQHLPVVKTDNPLLLKSTDTDKGASGTEPSLDAVNQALLDAANMENQTQPKHKNEFYVVTIAQNLGVFAVGSQTQMDDENSNKRGGYGTISFDVPEALQTVLIMAVTKIEAEGGRLICVLRSNDGGDATLASGNDGRVYSSEDFLKLIGQAQTGNK